VKNAKVEAGSGGEDVDTFLDALGGSQIAGQSGTDFSFFILTFNF
jgi:hypothetical protein